MLTSNLVTPSPLQQWDHPVLRPYVTREAEIEDFYLDDDEQIEQRIVAIWEEALDAHPDLAGAYLRLAAAVRDCGQHERAAQVLRMGIERGHETLWQDLLVDYPHLLTEAELVSAASDPALVKPAFAAMLLQRRSDLAMAVLRPIIGAKSAERSPGALSQGELLQLVGLLIQNEHIEEAQQLLAQVESSKKDDDTQLGCTIYREVLATAGHFDAEQRAALSELQLSRRTRRLRQALLLTTQAERRRFFSSLRRNCPELVATHQHVLRSLENELCRSRKVPTLIALLVMGATIWLWLVSQHT